MIFVSWFFYHNSIIILPCWFYPILQLLNKSGARRSWRKESSAATNTVFKSFSGGNSICSTGSSSKPVTRGAMVTFGGGCGGVESSDIRSDSFIDLNDTSRLRNSSPKECLEASSDSAAVPSSSRIDCLSSCGEVRREFSTSSTQVSQSGGSVVTHRLTLVEEVDQNSTFKAPASGGRVRFSNLAISDFCPGDIPPKPSDESDSDSCCHHRIADDGAFIFSTHWSVAVADTL